MPSTLNDVVAGLGVISDQLHGLSAFVFVLALLILAQLSIMAVCLVVVARRG